MFRTSLLVLILLVSLAPAARAATYYVAPKPTGSDAADGSLGKPWATILHAVQSTKPGDTVFLRAGTYNEDFEFRGDQGHGGANGVYWTLQGYQGETATLTAGLKIYMASYVRIQDLTFKDCAVGVNDWITAGFGLPHHIELKNNHFAGAQQTYGFIEVHGDNNTIEGNTIDCTGGGTTLDHGIYVHHGTGKVVRRNRINNISGYGIHVYDERKSSGDPKTYIKDLIVDGNVITGSRQRAGIVVANDSDTQADGVVIMNNVIVGNAWSGITVWGASTNIKIYNNTLHGNGSPAVQVASPASTVWIRNNILVTAPNGGHISNQGGTNVLAEVNLYWPSPAKLTGVTDKDAVTADPLFVSAPGDLHLKAGSPAIDKGLTLPEVTTDQEGRTRPLDGDRVGAPASDLGAYEYAGAVTPAPDAALASGDRGAASGDRGAASADGAKPAAEAGTPAKPGGDGCGCEVEGAPRGPCGIWLGLACALLGWRIVGSRRRRSS
jgi:parallel beta-helix repeat protein